MYYASGVAAAAQSITENPVDAANIAAILREEGIIPAAQLAAFTDPVSVYTDRSMGVHYDGNSLWLDNVSAAKGGKAWMNPFAASAVQYVGDLIEEVQGMGYEQVVLTGVQFPNIITRKQDFGASGGKSREGRAAQLTADIAAWQTRFAGSVTLWVSYPDALCTAATDALGMKPLRRELASCLFGSCLASLKSVEQGLFATPKLCSLLITENANIPCE